MERRKNRILTVVEQGEGLDVRTRATERSDWIFFDKPTMTIEGQKEDDSEIWLLSCAGKQLIKLAAVWMKTGNKPSLPTIEF